METRLGLSVVVGVHSGEWEKCVTRGGSFQIALKPRPHCYRDDRDGGRRGKRIRR